MYSRDKTNREAPSECRRSGVLKAVLDVLDQQVSDPTRRTLQDTAVCTNQDDAKKGCCWWT